MKNLIAVVISIGCLVGCAQVAKEVEKEESEVSALQLSESYELFKNNCYACHNPKAPSHDELLAPPMVAVKMRYMRSYTDRETFVKAVVNFVQNPSAQNALMKGALAEFNVMPEMPIDKQELENIANYIYDSKLEEPEWFEEHYEKMHGKRPSN